MSDTFLNIADGHAVPATASSPVHDPATLQVVASVARTSAEQLHDAVQAAQRAQKAPWTTDLARRRDALGQCADLLLQHEEELAQLLSREQGKTLAGAKGELQTGARLLRHFASFEDPDRLIRESEAGVVQQLRTPIGVVGLIVPWNFPITILMMKLAPALWVGNSVIVKPAPTTPLTTLRIASLWSTVLPPGILNTVTGEADVGQALVEHPGVGKISFTGSTATGRRVMASAADTLKRLTLELGGNDAAIVAGDADPQEIAARIYASAFSNAGQLCCAIKRLYVHRSVHDELVERLSAMARDWRVGVGQDANTQMGPLHTASQRAHVEALLSDARERGARIHVGGERIEGLPGHFLRPAIVSNLGDQARLVCEEQFGPALPVLAFDDLDDAVRRANASPYGLGASVWSPDIELAASVARRLEAVNLYINQHAVPPDAQIPFGGMKASGFGYELGEWGCDDFSVRKVLHIPARAQP